MSRETLTKAKQYTPIINPLSSGGILQRTCATCSQHTIAGGVCLECQNKQSLLQRSSSNQAETSEVPPIVTEVLTSSGQPLDKDTRTFMESRFGHDFARVRLHTNTKAAESAQAVKALSYTVGPNIVFENGQYAPQSITGQKLLAHELSHVVQQGAVPRVDQSALSEQKPNSVLQRQTGAGGAGVTGTSACGVPSGCPPEFCTPYFNKAVALGVRTSMAPVLLAGIATKVSSRVVPLWSQYLFGGSAPQNLSSQFGRDFTVSANTAKTTDILVNALKANLESSPPIFLPGNNQVTVDIPSRIGTEIAEIGNPASANVMDFNVIGEIPGNIAGGVGKTQLSCPVGAIPSPFEDDRIAIGTAQVTLLPNNSLFVIPSITYTVKDTIDLCPGNCGASIEQIATVPMSRMEASGISGDVPFTVDFPAPFRSFTTRPITPPTPPPAPPTPPRRPVTGEITASVLRIRQAPNTLSSVLGSYPQGANITILCQTTGENVSGNNIWDRTDRGFISDQYVRRIGTDTPPSC